MVTNNAPRRCSPSGLLAARPRPDAVLRRGDVRGLGVFLHPDRLPDQPDGVLAPAATGSPIPPHRRPDAACVGLVTCTFAALCSLLVLARRERRGRAPGAARPVPQARGRVASRSRGSARTRVSDGTTSLLARRRARPNEEAIPAIEEATQQLERALRSSAAPLSHPGFLRRTTPSRSWASDRSDHRRLRPLIYGQHTTEGVVGKDNPPSTPTSGQWPGLVGLLNTGACSDGGPRSRVWTAPDFTADDAFMARLEEWCTTAASPTRRARAATRRPSAPPRPPWPRSRARSGPGASLILMLGDTDGDDQRLLRPRPLAPHGFRAQDRPGLIIDRGRRIDDATPRRGLHLRATGVTSTGASRAADFDENATREQLRDYLVVLDSSASTGGLPGIQYQPACFRGHRRICRGALQLSCRPEIDGTPSPAPPRRMRATSSPWSSRRLLERKGPHGAHAPRRPLGRRAEGRFVWLLLTWPRAPTPQPRSGDATGRALTASRRCISSSPRHPGGREPAGQITWARTYLKGGRLWMDVGRGEVVSSRRPSVTPGGRAPALSGCSWQPTSDRTRHADGALPSNHAAVLRRRLRGADRALLELGFAVIRPLERCPPDDSS